jgi:hypothetical protein
MEKLSIEFSKEQLNNLKIFLLRTDLKGSEVEQFIEIANLLNTENVKETNNNDGN